MKAIAHVFLKNYQGTSAHAKRCENNRCASAVCSSNRNRGIKMLESLSLQEQLVFHLNNAKAFDKDYDERYIAVLKAIACAKACGYDAGFRFDPDNPEWPVAYIELPTSQVSWHMPQHPHKWDGHTIEEKFRRIDLYSKLFQPSTNSFRKQPNMQDF